MAIVIILAKTAHFIGLQSWLKLLCVNYHVAPWDFVGAVAYYFPRFVCLVFLRLSSPAARSVVAALFVPISGTLNVSNLCCHYHPSLRLRPRSAWKKKTCSCQKKKEEEGVHRGTERNVTAEAQRVGGECRRGRTWSWLRRSSTACLLSLGDANQATLPKPLPTKAKS